MTEVAKDATHSKADSYLAQENEPFNLKFVHGCRRIPVSERRRLPLLFCVRPVPAGLGAHVRRSVMYCPQM